MSRNYLNRLFSEFDNSTEHLSGPDGLSESTPEQDHIVEEQHLAEADPEITEETVIHSDYGYQPMTYFYSEDEVEEDEDDLTGEEKVALKAFLQDYAASRYYAEVEAEEAEEEIETIKQSLFELYAEGRLFSDTEVEEILEEAQKEDEPQTEAEVVKQACYDDYMTRLYSENDVEEDEEIVHVDETGEPVHPEVVKQALYEYYTSMYADDEDEISTEDAVQALTEHDEEDHVATEPTIAEEAVKKQSSIHSIESGVLNLLG